jgi:DNA-binding transcriptional regulator YhcF (GntR family)
MRLGLLGLGRIGAFHAETLTSLPAVDSLVVPGARLPAERDLATEYGVAYDTIRRATALLRDRGLIITIVGRGTYVTPEDQRP